LADCCRATPRPEIPGLQDAARPVGACSRWRAADFAEYCDRMRSGRLFDRPVFMRELLPEDLKLELARIDAQDAILAARYLARVVTRAHARQMSTEDRRLRRRELARNHSKTLDTPSWLWSSVVELIATHERGYLEHCRRLAFQCV
jgi:uncharacterized protein (DUF2252 family)